MKRAMRQMTRRGVEIAWNASPDPRADLKIRSPVRSGIYTIGVLESRIGGSTFWIPPGMWEVA